MAISIIQQTTKQTAATASSLALTLNSVTANNTIFVVAAEYRALTLTQGQTVSDGDGRYTRDAWRLGSSNTILVTIHRLSGASAGTHSITVTASTLTSHITAVAFECRSNYSLNRIYKEYDRRASGSGTNPATGSTLTTSQAASFSIAAVTAAATQASLTVGTSPIAWTSMVEELSIASSAVLEVDTVNATSAGSLSAGWTLASSAEWAALVCTYGEALT